MMNSSELRREARESLKEHKGKAGGTYLVYLLVSLLISFVASFIPVIGSVISSLLTAGILYGCITVLMRIKRREEVSAFACVGEGIGKFWKVFCCNLWVSLKLLPWILMMVVAIILSAVSVHSGSADVASQASLSAYQYQLASLEEEYEIEYLNYKGNTLIKGETPQEYEEWIETTEYSTKKEELENKISELELEIEKESVDLSGVFGILSFILMIVSTVMLIIRGFRYSLVNYLIYDNQELAAKDIVNKSAELMQGNCGRIFKLNLSFIGWLILVYIGFIVGAFLGILGIFVYIGIFFATIFFLTPYMQMANVCFYEELIKPTGGVETVETYGVDEPISNI